MNIGMTSQIKLETFFFLTFYKVLIWKLISEETHRKSLQKKTIEFKSHFCIILFQSVLNKKSMLKYPLKHSLLSLTLLITK